LRTTLSLRFNKAIYSSLLIKAYYISTIYYLLGGQDPPVGSFQMAYGGGYCMTMPDYYIQEECSKDLGSLIEPGYNVLICHGSRFDSQCMAERPEQLKFVLLMSSSREDTRV
jgi:hypothetical protein